MVINDFIQIFKQKMLAINPSRLLVTYDSTTTTPTTAATKKTILSFASGAYTTFDQLTGYGSFSIANGSGAAEVYQIKIDIGGNVLDVPSFSVPAGVTDQIVFKIDLFPTASTTTIMLNAFSPLSSPTAVALYSTSETTSSITKLLVTVENTTTAATQSLSAKAPILLAYNF